MQQLTGTIKLERHQWGWNVRYDQVTQAEKFEVRHGRVEDSYNPELAEEGILELHAYKLFHRGTESIPTGDALLSIGTLTEVPNTPWAQLLKSLGIESGLRVANVSSFQPFGYGSEEARGQFERRGIGRAALEFLEDQAVRLGCVGISVGAISNPGMKAFMNRMTNYATNEQHDFFARELRSRSLGGSVIGMPPA